MVRAKEALERCDAVNEFWFMSDKLTYRDGRPDNAGAGASSATALQDGCGLLR